jgi:hypothetical protein
MKAACHVFAYSTALRARLGRKACRNTTPKRALAGMTGPSRLRLGFSGDGGSYGGEFTLQELGPEDLVAAGLFSLVCAGALVPFTEGSLLSEREQPVGPIKDPKTSKAEKKWRFMKYPQKKLSAAAGKAATNRCREYRLPRVSRRTRKRHRTYPRRGDAHYRRRGRLAWHRGGGLRDAPIHARQGGANLESPSGNRAARSVRAARDRIHVVRILLRIITRSLK